MIREEALAPQAKFSGSKFELMVEDMHRLRMCGGFVPSRVDHLLKPRHLSPKVLKTEGGRAARVGEA